MPAGELRPNPRNWRVHTDSQRNALRGMLADVGYADALLARELADGSLELVDGHLRAETTPEAVVPVLVLDVNDEEATKILLTHDPLAAMAETDQQQFEELLRSVEFEHDDVTEMLDQVKQDAERASQAFGEPRDTPEVNIPEAYQVVVECSDEAEQQAVYERMRKEGYRCRVLTL